MSKSTGKVVNPLDLIEEFGADAFSSVVLSEQFQGTSTVARQRRVLATVKEKLATGELHAMSVKAYTPEEWREKQAAGSTPSPLVTLGD